MLEKRDGSYQLLDFRGPAKMETEEVGVIPNGAETRRVNMVSDHSCNETESQGEDEDDYDETGAWCVCVFKTTKKAAAGATE